MACRPGPAGGHDLRPQPDLPGAVEEAERALDAVHRAVEHRDLDLAFVGALGGLGLLAVDSGQPGRAGELAARVLSRAREVGVGDHPEPAMARLALARACGARGDWDEAAARAAHARDAARRSGYGPLKAAAITLAEVEAPRDHPRGQRLLDEAAAIVSGFPAPGRLAADLRRAREHVAGSGVEKNPPGEKLTDRQVALLRLLDQGGTTSALAGTLCVAVPRPPTRSVAFTRRSAFRIAPRRSSALASGGSPRRSASAGGAHESRRACAVLAW